MELKISIVFTSGSDELLLVMWTKINAGWLNPNMFSFSFAI